VLSPGVAGGKPGFVWDLGIVLLVPLVPVDWLVVMRSAPIKGVARNIKPHAIKPMEVSFISSSWFARPGRFNVCGRPGFLAIPGVGSAVFRVVQTHFAIARGILAPALAHLHEQK
jgi:hypothetical protein